MLVVWTRFSSPRKLVVTAVATNTDFIISKGASPLLLATTTLTRQQASDVLKVCIQLHIDTPDTPNWYLKHHKGLEYLNMAMAQVTDNPAIADGSSIHQEAKQQLHQYLRTYVQPLMQTGKPLDLKDILHRVNIRKPRLVQQLGIQQVQHMAQHIFYMND